MTVHESTLDRVHVERRVLDGVVDRLVATMHPERIVLFGSHVWGLPTPDSDLDLMVVVPSSDEPPHRRAQRAYRAVGPIGIPKDLLVLTHEEFERQAEVPTSLARRIQEAGLVLYDHR